MKYILLLFILSGCSIPLSPNLTLYSKGYTDIRITSKSGGLRLIHPPFNPALPIMGTYSEIGINYKF